MGGMLLNTLGHGETLDVGYNSPISGKEGQTTNARLTLPSLLGTDTSFTLEGIVDSVRCFVEGWMACQS